MPPSPPMIGAELIVDRMRFEFDAEHWFEQADDAEINSLALGGWGKSSPACQFAPFIAANDDGDLAAAFSALSRSGKASYFECRISDEDAEEWLEAQERRAAWLEENTFGNTSQRREVFFGGYVLMACGVNRRT